MRRVENLSKKIAATLLLSTMIFSGCSSEETLPDNNPKATTELTEKENVEENKTVKEDQEINSQEQEIDQQPETNKIIEFDIQSVLADAEEQAATLETQLKEDASLTQADMNDLAYQIYMIWDNTLNDLWKVLKENLDEEAMAELLEEQRAWITEKEDTINELNQQVGDGSIASLLCDQKAAELTKERVYELAAYFGETDVVPKAE